MTYYADFSSVSGDEIVIYNDFESANLRMNINEFNLSSTFIVTLPNHNGIYNTSFTVGNDIVVRLSDSLPFVQGDKIWGGTIEDISFSGKETNEKITLRCRDYGTELQRITVQPEVYNNTEISVIVTDLMTKYAPSDFVIQQNDVTDIILDHITFKHISLFDALKQLAEFSSKFFYTDKEKGLYLVPNESVSSGITFDNTNVRSATFRENADEVINQCFVYGARQYIGRKETFTGDGVGSVFTLNNKPYNTNITVNDAIQEGNIFRQNIVITSGIDYLVDIDQKNIIFVSGTSLGYSSIPPNNGSIIVNYDKSAPIVKLAENSLSQSLYGVRSKVIIDDAIIDPQMARDIALNTIDRNKIPAKEGTLKIKGTMKVVPGNTAVVNLPYHNVSSQTYTILEAQYNLSPQSLFAEDILSVKVSKKISDIIDLFKQILLDIKKLQAKDTDETDVITRLMLGAGSFGLRTSWELKTVGLGSSFVLGNTKYGVLGSTSSPANLVTGSFALSGTSTDPRGLTYKTGSLISADAASNHIFVHDGVSATLVGSFSSPEGLPQGLAFDGTNLISCDSVTDHIYIHDGISSTLTGSFLSPGPSINGLTVVESNLISADDSTNYIYIHDGITSTLTGSFLQSGGTIDSRGLAWNQNRLYMTEGMEDYIYIYSGLSSTLLGSFASPAGPSAVPQGITFSGNALIYADRGTDHIYTISNPGGFDIQPYLGDSRATGIVQRSGVNE